MNERIKKNNEEIDINFRKNYSTVCRINEDGHSYRLKDILNLPFNGQRSLSTPRSMLGRRTRTQKPETKCEPQDNQSETSILTSHTHCSQKAEEGYSSRYGPFSSTSRPQMDLDDPDVSSVFSNTICDEGNWSVFGKNIITNNDGINSQEVSVPLKQASSKTQTRNFELVPNRKFSSKGGADIKSVEPFCTTGQPRRISAQDRLNTLKSSFRKEENEMSWITRMFKKEMPTSNFVESKKDATNRLATAFSNKQFDMMMVHELPTHSNLILNDDGDVYVDNVEGNNHPSEENIKTHFRHSVGHNNVKHYFQNESSIKQRNFDEDISKATDETCRQMNKKFNSSDSDVSNYSSCDQEEGERRHNFLTTIFKLINELSIEKVEIDKKWKILRQEQKCWNEKWNQLSGSLPNYHSSNINNISKKDRKAV